MAIACALVLPVLLLASCGDGGPEAAGAGTGSAGTPGKTAPPAEPVLYEANAIVFDDGEQRPMLCLGGLLLMLLPPRCGEVPVAGCDWGLVEGAESLDGATWGRYHVVGTYDGRVFTLTEVGPFEDEPFEAVDLSSPCPEPPGGWPAVDAERTTQEYARAASEYASSQPDYVGSWNTHLQKELEEFGPVVFNAVFTGDVDVTRPSCARSGWGLSASSGEPGRRPGSSAGSAGRSRPASRPWDCGRSGRRGPRSSRRSRSASSSIRAARARPPLTSATAQASFAFSRCSGRWSRSNDEGRVSPPLALAG